MQPEQPGQGGYEKEVVRQRVEPSAAGGGGAEVARDVAVEEVGGAREQQTEADQAAVSGQRCDREHGDQEDPGARQKVGQPP